MRRSHHLRASLACLQLILLILLIGCQNGQRLSMPSLQKLIPDWPSRHSQAQAPAQSPAPTTRTMEARAQTDRDPFLEIPAIPEPATQPAPEPSLAAQRSEPTTQPALTGRVGVLVTALQDPDPQLRRESAEMLGQLGPDAAGAQPALQAAQNDPDPAVRSAAAEALAKLRRPAP